MSGTIDLYKATALSAKLDDLYKEVMPLRLKLVDEGRLDGDDLANLVRLEREIRDTLPALDASLGISE